MLNFNDANTGLMKMQSDWLINNIGAIRKH